MAARTLRRATIKPAQPDHCHFAALWNSGSTYNPLAVANHSGNIWTAFDLGISMRVAVDSELPRSLQKQQPNSFPRNLLRLQTNLQIVQLARSCEIVRILQFRTRKIVAPPIAKSCIEKVVVIVKLTCLSLSDLRAELSGNSRIHQHFEKKSCKVEPALSSAS